MERVLYKGILASKDNNSTFFLSLFLYRVDGVLNLPLYEIIKKQLKLKLNFVLDNLQHKIVLRSFEITNMI